LHKFVVMTRTFLLRENRVLFSKRIEKDSVDRLEDGILKGKVSHYSSYTTLIYYRLKTSVVWPLTMASTSFNKTEQRYDHYQR